jgi:hypothetical protein
LLRFAFVSDKKSKPKKKGEKQEKQISWYINFKIIQAETQ